MENLHLLYNKTLYDKLGYYQYDNEKKKFVFNQNRGGYIPDDNGELFTPDLDPKNGSFKRIVNARFLSGDYTPSDIATHTVVLKTTYPGLLVGSGYAHGISDNNDAKIGFFFDYVTGQPVIPGSSVKGVIRSAFNHPEILREELNKPELTDDDVNELKKDIFENKDIFFDAVVRYVPQNKPLLGEDYITPHASPIKNPVPVKFIKVMPGVFFEFRFVLFDTQIKRKDGTIIELTAVDKQTMFRNILLLLGVGAKTNVGYGNLSELTPEDKKAIGQ